MVGLSLPVLLQTFSVYNKPLMRRENRSQNCCFGRSMENAIVNGERLGYIKVPKGTFVDAAELNQLPK